MFESKPIKRGDKIPLEQHKNSLKVYTTPETNVFSEKQLRYCTYFPKPLHLTKTQQHGLSPNNEKRTRRLVEIISQNIEGTRDNDKCAEDDQGYQEVGRRNTHYTNGDRRNNFNSEQQQLSHERNKPHSDIRRPMVSSAE